MDTILVIEDKDSMLAMLKQTLETEGYQVVTAKDGAEGIKRLSDERIGLVLYGPQAPEEGRLRRCSKPSKPTVRFCRSSS